jgi:hypothetical protein
MNHKAAFIIRKLTASFIPDPCLQRASASERAQLRREDGLLLLRTF